MHTCSHKHLSLMAILCLLSQLFLPLLPHFAQAQGDVWWVPEDYPTIQAAVDAAAVSPGDIIKVSPDVYYEGAWVTKSLRIEGQDKCTTIIDGSESGYGFWLDTDSVTISGFTLRNCFSYAIMAYYSGGHVIDDNILLNNAYGVCIAVSPNANSITNNTFLHNGLRGIDVDSSDGNTISNNDIFESTYGIKLSGISEGNSITNNTISGTSYGIHLLDSPNNYIQQNTISSEVAGIVSTNSDHTDIRNNTISESAYGIEIYDSTQNTILANTVAQNSYGIYLIYALTNTVDYNQASNNHWSIALYDSDSNTIIQNTFSFNAYGPDLTAYSSGNTVAWNNILNNTLQRHQDSTSGGNTWHKRTGGVDYGNYWSNYAGEDTDNPPDGVGDTLLPHMGVDYNPLMSPWSTVHDLALISVTTSDDAVYQGQVVDITVVVRNEGTTAENFNVTAKYINCLIGTQEVNNLTRLKTTTLLFSWNTTSAPTGFNYEISAETEPTAGETDKLDNIFIDGTIMVKIPGDVNGDGIVDIYDLARVGKAYGAEPGDPNWDEEADINGDRITDIYDLAICGKNYGKSC